MFPVLQNGLTYSEQMAHNVWVVCSLPSRRNKNRFNFWTFWEGVISYSFEKYQDKYIYLEDNWQIDYAIAIEIRCKVEVLRNFVISNLVKRRYNKLMSVATILFNNNLPSCLIREICMYLW